MNDSMQHDPLEPEPVIEPRLARALDAHAVRAPRAEFRAALKTQFLNGAHVAEDADPQADAALAAGLDAPNVPHARAEFRESLRTQFLDAPVETSVASESSADHKLARKSAARRSTTKPRGQRTSASKPSSRRRGELAPSPAQGSRRKLQLSMVGLVAAAAIVLLVLRPWQSASSQPNPTRPGYGVVAGGGEFVDHWFVDPTSYVSGEVVIDGVLQPKDVTPAELSARIANAKTIGTQGSNLRVQFGDWFVIGLDGDSLLDIGALPDDPRAGDFTLAAKGGGYQVRTGPAFKDESRKLRFRTNETEVDVVGTIFGINCFGTGTCVCCIEGQVHVSPCAKALAPRGVVADRMSFVYADEEEPMDGAAHAEHVTALKVLQAYEFRPCPR